MPLFWLGLATGVFFGPCVIYGLYYTSYKVECLIDSYLSRPARND